MFTNYEDKKNFKKIGLGGQKLCLKKSCFSHLNTCKIEKNSCFLIRNCPQKLNGMEFQCALSDSYYQHHVDYEK